MVKTSEALQEFMEKVIDVAKKELQSKGEVTPIMAFGNQKENKKFEIKIVPIPNFMMEPNSKNLLSKIMFNAASALQPEFFVFLSDTWVKSESIKKETKTEQLVDDLRKQYKEVRLMPGRKEALLVVGETNTKQYTHMVIYEKQGDGTYVFIKDKTTISDTENKSETQKNTMSGRFSGILFGRPVNPEKN